MVAARRGGSTLGCLVTLLIIGTAVYVGIALGRPWFRYEQFRDEMTSAARFSTTLTDAQILTRLRAVADTLGLPPDAKKIIVKRLDPSGGVVISVKYTERVTLPLYGEKVFKFAPKIVGGEPLSSLADTAGKLRSLDDAARWRQGATGQVVFTNGVFDLLHAGHIHVLESARALGDALIVGVNTDASVRRLEKGAERPIVAAADRARVLAALACVDCVVLFDEDTPAQLIAALQPDVLVKGGDYSPDTVVGADTVRARGGRVVIIPLLPDRSTTRLVERLRVTP